MPAPEPASAKISQRDAKTKFAFVRAYTQGQGVWVHWQMETEFNNYGFYVYRLNRNGQTRISEMELGSAFSSANQTIFGKHYAYFDDAGTTEDTYFVEAKDAKRTVKSGLTSVSVVNELPKVGDGTLFKQAPREEALIRPTSTALSLPAALNYEVTANALTPNPTRHTEVIAQNGVRIKASASGLIRVNKALLSNAGFNVSGDSSRWQLYLEGNELPLIIGPNADYIEFLGKALDTVETNVRTYYLIEGNTAGKRAYVANGVPGRGRTVAPSYNQNFTLKERIFYVIRLLNGDDGNFFGNVINNTGYTINFQLSSVDLTPGDRTLTVGLQGFSINAHSVEIRLNGNLLPTNALGNAMDHYTKTYTFPSSYLKEGANTLTMRSVLTSDTSLFDYVSIDYARGYRAIDDRLDFYSQLKRDTVVSGFTTQNVRLFDVTYDDQLIEIVNSTMVQTDGTYGPLIPASRSRVYYATEASNFAVPTSVEPNDPAMLGSPSNAATMVIISHASLMPEAKAWRDYRISKGTNAIVVDVDEIYDEFNYGTASSLSIRSFLQYAKNNWQTPPAYVLLIGDASRDPRGYQTGGVSWNMVPTRMVNTVYEETGSDESLADFNNDGLAEIPIGRIASRNGLGVSTVLSKTIQWEASITPDVFDRGALFAHDQFDGFDFKIMSQKIAAKLPAGTPTTYVERGKPTNSAAKTAVINAFNTGPYIANYSGHGTGAAWRDSSFFYTQDITDNLDESTALPTLVTALTCLNAYFVTSGDSFAEAITKVPNGGAVAIWASTGETTPDVQEVMALRFYEQLAAGNIPRLGDLIRDAKSNLVGGRDVRLSWALIGDPMLKVR